MDTVDDHLSGVEMLKKKGKYIHSLSIVVVVCVTYWRFTGDLGPAVGYCGITLELNVLNLTLSSVYFSLNKNSFAVLLMWF